MNLIDRYIVLVFARVFFICFLTLLGMYIVADFVNNFSELFSYGKTHGGLWRVLLGYYGPQVPWFFDLISRISALIAAVFAVTWLQRNNELVALMSAGISRWRIVKPLVISVIVVSVVAALNREAVIPRLAAPLARDARSYAGDRAETLHPRYDHATGIFLGGESVVPGKQQIDKPKFRLPSSLAARGTQLVANRANYVPKHANHPAGFLLIGVSQPARVNSMTTLRLDGKPVVFAPADTDWLEADQLFVASDLPFSYLEEGHAWRQFSSTLNLIRGARNPSLDYGADVSVTIHSRFVQPVLDVILLFLGLPIVLSREARNPFMAAGSCLFIVTLFLVVVLAFQVMGMNYLIRPALATWCPLMIFIPLAMVMSEPLRR